MTGICPSCGAKLETLDYDFKKYVFGNVLMENGDIVPPVAGVWEDDEEFDQTYSCKECGTIIATDYKKGVEFLKSESAEVKEV